MRADGPAGPAERDSAGEHDRALSMSVLVHESIPAARRGCRLATRAALATALWAALAGGAGAQEPARAPYDVVIRNGRVLDGNGNPWIAADVAIRDGRFVQIRVLAQR